MAKGNSGSRASCNNRSNQMNPNNAAYQSSRSSGAAGKASRDNRSVQMNPINRSYSRSRVRSAGGSASPVSSVRLNISTKKVKNILRDSGKTLKTGKGKAVLAATLGAAFLMADKKKR